LETEIPDRKSLQRIAEAENCRYMRNNNRISQRALRVLPDHIEQLSTLVFGSYPVPGDFKANAGKELWNSP
jgi:hypothetical protein